MMMSAGIALADLPRHPDAPAPPSTVADGATVVWIPLADRVTLADDLYLPRGKGRHPVLLEVTPTAAAAPEGLACISPNASFQSAFDGPSAAA
jgi:hypothetical protein